MNKNLLAAFGIGALLAVGGTYLIMSDSKPAPMEITSKTTEQTLPQEPVAPAPAPVVEEPAPPPPPAPRRAAVREPAPRKHVARNTPRPEEPMKIEIPASMATQPVVTTPAPAPPAPVATARPEPTPVEIRRPDPIVEEARRKEREPAQVTIPAGTQIMVRLSERLAADKIQTGDTFHATLDAPLEVGGFVLAERGARAVGRVVESDRAGRVKGVSKLSLELTQFTTSDGQTVRIQSDPFNREGDTSKKSDAAKIGAGAAVGAALGAIFGGGKGAAIGAGAGGGAGAGTVLMTRGKPAVIEVETRIPFQTKGDVVVTEKIK